MVARRQPKLGMALKRPPSEDEEDDDAMATDDEDGGSSPMVSDDENEVPARRARAQADDDEEDEEEQDDDDDDDDEVDDGPAPRHRPAAAAAADELPTLRAHKQRQQQRAPIYDAEAMHDRLEDIAWAESDGATFAETLALTSSRPSCPDTLDVDDDLARELCFYNQALEAAKEAVARFEAAGLAWHRPADYYAEMVKSDDHMAKVKDRLMYEQRTIEEGEERRKAREQKAFAKQTQAAKQRERAAEKKKAIESVYALRKQRARSGFAGELDDEAAVDGASAFRLPEKRGGGGQNRPAGGAGAFNPRRDGPGGRQQALGFKPGERIRRGDGPEKGKKRMARDEKYGFGGRKRLAKQNDARSAADMDSYRPAKFADQYASRRGRGGGGGVRKGGRGGGGGRGGRFGGGGGRGAGARPGKAARQQQRGGGGGGGGRGRR